MNEFYDFPKRKKYIIAYAMVFIFLIILLAWVYLTTINLWLAYLLVFIITPLYQFFLTPMLTLSGTYTYLSPMLLVFQPSDKRYDLHNGTSFDYLMVLKGKKPGIEIRNSILFYFIEGLLVIINKIEKGELPETVEVRGSSYFFSENTATRLGFKLSKTGFSEQANILINYLDLLWMFSIANGKLTFPSLKAIKTASIIGSDLVAKKDFLIQLLNFLNRNNS